MIKVEDLWKEYKLGATVDLGRNFREAISQWRWSGSKTKEQTNDVDSIWALREIDFELSEGKSLGLIGNNGAGKSTLLKVLSRITRPSRGRITMQGSVSSLLEVGTGFHPELTGRENIFLYGAIMGMTKRDIQKKFDEIIDYAGVEKFLDTPVKRYSSGMYVRLAFSIAAHVEPDILIVDEVLAVGDQEFREKCLGKMDDVANSGRTVIFVSHNMNSIASLCHEVAWLDNGRLKQIGDTAEIISSYKNHKRQNFSFEFVNSLFEGPLRKHIKIDELLVNNVSGSHSVYVDVNRDIKIRLSGSSDIDLESAVISATFHHEDTRLFTVKDVDKPQKLNAGVFEVEFTIPANTLASNAYGLGIGFSSSTTGQWMWCKSVLEITVADSEADSNTNNNDVFKSVGSGHRLNKNNP